MIIKITYIPAKVKLRNEIYHWLKIIYTYVCMPKSIHIYHSYLCEHIHTCTSIDIYPYVHACTRMHVCAYVNIGIFISTSCAKNVCCLKGVDIDTILVRGQIRISKMHIVLDKSLMRLRYAYTINSVSLLMWNELYLWYWFVRGGFYELSTSFEAVMHKTQLPFYVVQ